MRRAYVISLASLAFLLLGGQSAPQPTMIEVPAGVFYRGSSPKELAIAKKLCLRELVDCSEYFLFKYEGPARKLYLSTFWIDKTEVTQADYQVCVDAGVCRPPAELTQPLGPTLPVVGVSWQDAKTFCAFRGARLPTEAEWEKAARGSDGRLFPWGDVYDPQRSNHGQSGPLFDDPSDGFANLAPVGSYPTGASPYGVLDLSGNAWEWVADFYIEEAYGSAPYQNPKGPLLSPFKSPRRVLRGGSFRAPIYSLRTANRAVAEEVDFDVDIGFRCAQ